MIDRSVACGLRGGRKAGQVIQNTPVDTSLSGSVAPSLALNGSE
ncbi:hypothetical protein [Marinobacter vulgaris]|nr:hypothetical protein [Marinobacter vulgaris]